MALPARLSSVAQNLALDPQGTDVLRRAARSDSAAGARAVAQQFEALLMQQMLKSMREAGQGFGEPASSSMRLFNSMQDQQFSQALAMRGGTGLTDAIVRQIQQQGGIPGSNAGQAAQARLPVVTGKAASPAGQAANPAASGTGDAERFLGKLADVAEGVSAALGLSPQLVLAHAALESGWGRKSIKNPDGSESHNLFGIKATKDWRGKTTDVLTSEFVDGRMQKRVETFRVYDSYADAFSDYAGLLKRRYGAALGVGSDSAGFGRALQTGGYATDPQYASKLARVAESVSARLAARQSGSSQRA